ncbi:MAG TPA: iron uptake system protein EfeO [Mycobacteriales bacterium]|nr:iron uptake system protein EfeO [Mycobacteriales bacterium]
MSRPPLSRLAGIAVGVPVVIALAAAGCGSGHAPGDTAGAGSRTVSVTLTPDGCQPDPASVPAGATTFTVVNTHADAVSELELLKGDRVIGEKENLTPGLSGSFSLNLDGGSYTLSCPGAKKDSAVFTVTRRSAAKGGGTDGGSPSAGPVQHELDEATAGYAAYVRDQSGRLVTATEAFAAAVRSGDVARARSLYPPARVFYERIEPVAESFGDLDPAIDARINDVADPASWSGFHRIEQALWQKNTTAGMAPVADRLVSDVKRLNTMVGSATYQPAQLANGASELLDEVAKSKITGEEERYSHIDLVDFAANIDGAKKAFDLLSDAVEQIDPDLAGSIDSAFDQVDTSLARYHNGQGAEDYVSYTALSRSDLTTLARQVDALAEPLSKVGARVVGNR